MKKIVIIIFVLTLIYFLPGNNVLEFNGSSDKIVVSSDAASFPPLFADLDSNSFTIEFLIYFEDYIPFATRIIDITFTSSEYLDIMYDSQRIYMRMCTPSYSYKYAKSTNSLELERWYHFVIKWDHTSGNLVFVIDNVIQDIGTTGVSAGNNNCFYIGTKSSSGGFFKGKIEEFRIWDNVKTNWELRKTYGKELTGMEAGLYLYYNMNEFQVGDILEDITGNGFEADCEDMSDEAIVNSNVWNRCVTLDGLNDHIIIMDAEELNGSNYTLAFWFYPEDLTVESYLFSKGSDGYYLKIDANEQLVFNGFATSGLDLQTGRWYHVAAVRTNSIHQIYLDGREQTLTGTAAVSSNSDPLYFGNRVNSYFTGKIDEIQFYDQALNANEISNIIYAEYQNITGLVAWFECNRYDGGILSDARNNMIAYLAESIINLNGSVINVWFDNFIGSNGNWIIDGLIGKNITFFDPDFLQTRVISDNTNDRIFVAENFFPVLALGLEYQISSNLRMESTIQYPYNLPDNYSHSPVSIWEEHQSSWSGGLIICSGNISGSFLQASHNGQQGVSVENLNGSGLDNRLSRIWFLESSGSVSGLELEFDFSEIQGNPIILGSDNDYDMLYRSSDTGDFTLLTSNVSKLLVDDSVLKFSGTGLDSPSGYFTIGAISSAPLPVTLSSFTGFWNAGGNLLKWTTLSECSNSGWNVYRGYDPNTFLKINPDFITGNGTSSQSNNYEFQDPFNDYEQVEYHYWLESISHIGASELFGPVRVIIPEEDDNTTPEIPVVMGIFSFPNPFNPVTRIRTAVPVAGYYSLILYNIKGQRLKYIIKDAFLEKDRNYYFELDADCEAIEYCSGIYLLQLKGAETTFLRKIVLTK